MGTSASAITPEPFISPSASAGANFHYTLCFALHYYFTGNSLGEKINLTLLLLVCVVEGDFNFVFELICHESKSNRRCFLWLANQKVILVGH